MSAAETFESDGLDEAFSSHAPQLLRQIRRIVGNDAADDVLQDVYIRASAARGRIDPTRPVEAWLNVIARNLCVDVVRAGQRRPCLDDVDVEEECREESLASYLAGARRDAIAEALSVLPDRQRRALALHAIEGKSYAEVRAIEGLASVDSVKALIRRGRASFRERYSQLAESRGLHGWIGLGAVRLRGTFDRRLDPRSISVAYGIAIGVPTLALSIGAGVPQMQANENAAVAAAGRRAAAVVPTAAPALGPALRAPVSPAVPGTSSSPPDETSARDSEFDVEISHREDGTRRTTAVAVKDRTDAPAIGEGQARNNVGIDCAGGVTASIACAAHDVVFSIAVPPR